MHILDLRMTRVKLQLLANWIRTGFPVCGGHYQQWSKKERIVIQQKSYEQPGLMGARVERGLAQEFSQLAKKANNSAEIKVSYSVSMNLLSFNTRHSQKHI